MMFCILLRAVVAKNQAGQKVSFFEPDIIRNFFENNIFLINSGRAFE
jgi:hypothetical protein